MYWSYPKSDLEQNLSTFLNRRLNSCTHKPAGPESARLHSVKDFLAELEQTGIQIKGFTTTMKEESSGSFRNPSINHLYTITCDALPASECYVCIEPGGRSTSSTGSFSSSTQFYARIYDAMTYYGEFVYDNNFGFVYRFLEQFEAIAAELPDVRAKFEKQQKINELTRNNIEVWFSQICEELGYPYNMDMGKIRSKLFVKLDAKTQLEIIIQHKNFQEVMPELSGLIKTYSALLEGSKARVLIGNTSPQSCWQGEGGKQKEDDWDD
jgi:hypothetical protein